MKILIILGIVLLAAINLAVLLYQIGKAEFNSWRDDPERKLPPYNEDHENET